MSNVQTLPDPEETPETLLAQYKEEIKYYEKESGAWDERARKILKRYKDERSPRDMKVARFNVLYANIEILTPAIYGKNPKADIERRFKDKDPLGRVTSDILERCTDYFTNTEAFRSSLRAALFDRLTAGRGSVWTRYVPHFRDAEIQADNPEEADLGVDISDTVEEMAADNKEPLEEVYNEEVVTDYTHWSDLGHNWARTWDEIWLIWKKVYLSRKELVTRFGKKKAAKIPLDYYPKGLNDQKKETTLKKAVIYECCDKTEKKLRWLHKDVAEFLDEKDDALKLPDFFPAPKPLYSILANDSMIPVPDYIEYQDQANELDELTSRISTITKAIKVAGVYDSSAPALERLLAEGVENKLIAVDQWALFAEKGGLKGTISLLPMEEIANALLILYQARDKVKADVYELSGVADVLRATGDPDESATQTNTKGKFGALRLSDKQDDMARFARDAVKNVAIVIANHFSIDTIKKISGVRLLTMQEKQTLQMQMQIQQQMAQQAAMQKQAMQQNGAPSQGQSPQASPIDSDTQEMLENPTWEEVEQLLRDQPELTFKIDIEIDSTVKMDDDQQKEEAIEFLEGTGKFLAAMQNAPPIAQPLLAEMLMFGVRRFRIGKSIEAQFNIFVEKLEKQAAQAPLNPPNPEMLKVQAQQQQDQAELVLKQKEIEMNSRAQAQNDARDAQREDQRAQREYEYKMAEMKQQAQLKLREMEMDADIEMKKHAMTTEASSKPSAVMQIDTDGALGEVSKKIGDIADNVAQANLAHTAGINKAVSTLANSVEALHKHATKPKTVSMQGRDGRMLKAIIQ